MHRDILHVTSLRLATWRVRTVAGECRIIVEDTQHMHTPLGQHDRRAHRLGLGECRMSRRPATLVLYGKAS